MATLGTGTRTVFGVVVALALVAGSDRVLAGEAGSFGNTLQGATIGLPVAVPPPPGLYGLLETAFGPSGVGTGQNNGTTVHSYLYVPEVVWSTGYQFLGANVTAALAQPFLNVDFHSSNEPGPPFASFYNQNINNTLITPILLQWRLGTGLFASAGFTFAPPDGSKFNGTNNPDYWTYEPRAAIAYLTKDWHLSATFKYDINSASAGHTGAYQVLASQIPNPALASEIASFGNGYTSGQEAFLDLTAAYQYGKWEFGPVASFKWQTTDDTPGNGFTCAEVAAVTTVIGHPTPCGKAQNYSLGGLVGYDFGPARLQLWATDTVHAEDDYSGWAVYTRLSFKFWGEEPPAQKPMYTK